MRNLFALVAFGLVACGGDSTTGDRATTILGLTGDPTAGADVYAANCEVCHAPSGLGEADPSTSTTYIGVDLTEAAGETDADAEFIPYILDGIGEMTAFGDLLSDQEIADVLAYLHDGLIQ